MSELDLSFLVPILTNILKSTTDDPSKWDAFDIISKLNWMKFFILIVLLFVVSFIFIGIPFPPPANNIRYFRIQVKNFSFFLMVSFLTSLIFPQNLFWTIYPIILLLFSCSTPISCMLMSFVQAVQFMASTVSARIIFFAARNLDEVNFEVVHEVEQEMPTITVEQV